MQHHSSNTVNATASTCLAATTTAAPATTVAIISLQGLVSCDFDGHFMTSSYSLDVRHIPLHNLFFLILGFHN
jgi:hypothetical protein